MSSERGMAIVALGARTAVGLTAATTAAARRAGISRLAEHPTMVDRSGDSYNVSMDRTIETPHRLERILELSRSAIDEALQGWRDSPSTPLHVFVALPELGPYFTEADAQGIAQRVAAHLVARCKPVVVPIPRGNAAGALALWRAAMSLRERQASVTLVVGSDSHLDPDVLEDLDEAGRLMSVTNRWGYPPGEGAAALLMVDPTTAKSLGVPVLARVQGTGVSEETALIATEDVCVGVGLAEAMKSAIAEAGGSAIEDIYCDINGERYRASEYTYAMLRLHPTALRDASQFQTGADTWGDVGAATVPLLATVAVTAGRRGYARGPRSIVWASSESGLRGALVLQSNAESS